MRHMHSGKACASTWTLLELTSSLGSEHMTLEFVIASDDKVDGIVRMEKKKQKRRHLICHCFFFETKVTECWHKSVDAGHVAKRCGKQCFCHLRFSLFKSSSSFCFFAVLQFILHVVCCMHEQHAGQQF